MSTHVMCDCATCVYSNIAVSFACCMFMFMHRIDIHNTRSNSYLGDKRDSVHRYM